MRSLPIYGLLLGLILVGSPAEGKRKGDQALRQIDDQVDTVEIDKNDKNWRMSLPRPKVVLSWNFERDYIATMKTTKGTIRIRLMPDIAPMHVTSWAYLTRLGFYDGLTFHRVIPGFMAQGGCPLGSGQGNPGYMFSPEPNTRVKHDRPGLLSHANSKRPNTDGSQFFLTFSAAPWLDGKHTIYGEVVEGLESLKRIEAVGSRTGATAELVTIQKMTIAVE